MAGAGRAAHHIAARIGQIGFAVALHIGDVGLLFLIGIAQSAGHGQPVGQIIVHVQEQAQRVHLIIAAAKLVSRRARDTALKLAPFVIVEIVGEIVDAGGQAQPVEKPPGVAQLIAELFRLLLCTKVEFGQREIGLAVRGQAVKVADGVALRGAPAENIGQRAVAERHVPVQPGVEEVHLGIQVAVVIDKEVMVASVIDGRIL